MTIPQVVGMYKNDRTRKEILVDFGFRLPSALDNRPLTFEEFEVHVNQALYVSATPGPYELERSERVVEQLVRPTGIVDPPITVRPTEGQIDDLLEEIRGRVDRGERALVTTLTKKMAEDLADYLKELGVKVQYLHSEVDTLERVAILRDLRLGVYDVLVGINLLREGLDLPEVTLVAILDADKEGFLRSAWSLIQMIGRAARNTGGEVVMYADTITESMRIAIDETDRRRAIQQRHNIEHGIEPQTIIKGIHDINDRLRAVADNTVMYSSERRERQLADADKAEVERLVAKMEAEMKAAAKQLEFERAAALRDEIQQIRLRVLEEDASVVVARAAERAARDAALPAKERAAAHRPGGGAPDGSAVVRGHRGHRAAIRRGAGRRRGRRRGLGRHRGGAVPGHPRRARRRRRRLAGALARPADLGPDGDAQHPPPDGPATQPAHPRVLTERWTARRASGTIARPSGSGSGTRSPRWRRSSPASGCSSISGSCTAGNGSRTPGWLRVTDRRVFVLVGRWLGRNEVIEIPSSLVQVRPAPVFDPVIRLEVRAHVDDDVLAFRAWDWFPPATGRGIALRIRQESMRTTQLRERLLLLLGPSDGAAAPR